MIKYCSFEGRAFIMGWQTILCWNCQCRNTLGRYR